MHINMIISFEQSIASPKKESGWCVLSYSCSVCDIIPYRLN